MSAQRDANRTSDLGAIHFTILCMYLKTYVTQNDVHINPVVHCRIKGGYAELTLSMPHIHICMCNH